MKTHKLSIWITHSDGDSERVSVFIETPGQARSTSSVPYSVVELRTLTKCLEALSFDQNDFTIVEVAWLKDQKMVVSSSSGLAFSSNLREIIGTKLFNFLFSHPDCSHQFEKVWAFSENDSTELQIQLHFDYDPNHLSQLADYPWELLYRQGFLAAGRVTFSRYLRYSGTPSSNPVLTPIRVLIVNPRPKILNDYSQSGYEFPELKNMETRRIEAAVKNSSGFDRAAPPIIKVLPKNDFHSLISYLSQARDMFNILHFDGHGAYGWRCNHDECGYLHLSVSARPTLCPKCGTPLSDEPQGYLAFEAAEGSPAWVGADEIASALLQHRNWNSNDVSGGISAVVLTACRSAVSRSSYSLFNGVAQKLIQSGIPVVVAMGYLIEENAAAKFVSGLYESLVQGDPFRIAVGKARLRIGFKGSQWYRPILYERSSHDQAEGLQSLSKMETVFSTIYLTIGGDPIQFSAEYYEILRIAMREVLNLPLLDDLIQIITYHDRYITIRLPNTAADALTDPNGFSIIRNIEERVITLARERSFYPDSCLIMKVSREDIVAIGSYTLDFENRIAERQWILDPGSPRYLEVCAPAGYGKTYLMNQLEQDFRVRHGATVVRINFKEPSAPKTGVEALKLFAEQLGEDNIETIDDLAKYIFRNALQFVVILDSTELALGVIRQWIIKELLPQIEARRAPTTHPLRLITASRHRINEWQSRVRLPPFILSPFSTDIIERLIRKQVEKRDLKVLLELAWYKELAKEIFDLSKGHPLIICHLVRWLDEVEDFAVTAHFVREQKLQVFHNYVHPVIQYEVIGHVTDRDLRLLTSFFAILRGCSVNVVSYMSRAATSSALISSELKEALGRSSVDALTTLRYLSKARLISVTDDMYRFDTLMRQLLSLGMELDNSVMYWQAHKWAAEMYDDWIAGRDALGESVHSLCCDSTQARYMIESLYHHLRLMCREKISQEEAKKRLGQLRTQYLTEARSTTGWNGQTLDLFYQGIQNDEEICLYLEHAIGTNDLYIINPSHTD